MGKIFVRERTHAGPGAGRPRFAVVGIQGADVQLYHTHLRRTELEKLAGELGADIVFLPRGDAGETEGTEGGLGAGRGRGMWAGRRGRRHRAE